MAKTEQPKKNPLEKLYENFIISGIDYLSPQSTTWFYNRVEKLSGGQKDEIFNLILNDNSSKFLQMIPNHFYYFNYSPIELGNASYERYDRRPLIYAIKNESGTIHGLNINYLYKIEKILLVNYLLRRRFLRGNIQEKNEFLSKVRMPYETMKSQVNFPWHNVIYRKYHFSRMTQIKMLPKRYLKAFVPLNPHGFANQRSVYMTVFHKLREIRNTE
jgi:hypothetical protein